MNTTMNLNAELLRESPADLWLLTIYDKSERESISDAEIRTLREEVGI